MIRCSHLTKGYPMGSSMLTVLDDVSLTIEQGEFVAIMGPSGSGKSTLMNVLGLLDVPDSGSYQLLGKETSTLSENELAQVRTQRIGFIFQQFNLLKRTSALENVALPLIYSSSNTTDTSRAQELLHLVGLGDRREHHPNELSGGQQQRVAIARALINAPSIILADEPTGNLDSKSQSDIMALLSSLHQQGMTVILVTHEEEVAAYAHRIIRMRDGKIVSDTRQDGFMDTPLALPALQKPASSKKLWILAFILGNSAHVKQAFKALSSNKVRTFLSVLGILIGVAAVIAMLALGKGAQKSIEARLASLGSNLIVLRSGNSQSRGISMDSGASTRLNLDDAKAISTLLNVKRVGASVSGKGQTEYGGKNHSTPISGVQIYYQDIHAAHPSTGRFFTQKEDTGREKVALIGMTVVRQLFADTPDSVPRNPIGEFIKLNRMRFQVIGILPEKGGSTFRDEDDIIVIPLSTAMKRVLGKVYVDSIDIEVHQASQMDEVQDQIKGLMNQRHHVPVLKQEEAFELRNMADIQDTLASTSKTLSVLLASIAGISLFVGGIGIMNIMLVSVTERTREIGLRKALGATPSDILIQFLIEAVVISLVGGIVGILLGWGVTLALSTFAGWTVVFSSLSVVIAFIFSSLIGIVFGIWPAKRASALHPIDALRFE